MLANRKRSGPKRRVASRPDCGFLAGDVLEAYILGRLPGQQSGADDDHELQAIEEHLLCCEACQMRAEAEENQLDVLRVALAAFSKPLKSMTAGRI
jgi:hypothetical protein